MAVEQAPPRMDTARGPGDRRQRPRGPSTTCGSPGRRRSAGRSGRCSGAGRQRQVLGAAPRRPARPARRVAGGHRPERRRQEHAPPGARRDHPSVRGRGRRLRARLRAADARRRLRQGADRAGQHPARRRLPRARRRGDPPAPALDHRVRRARRLHRRAAQDLLVRDARPPRLRDRDLGRPGHPAARRGARHRRRELPGQVEGTGDRDRRRRPRRSSW